MKKPILFALLVLGCTRVVLTAQPFSIDWFTVDGGGGTSSGGQFTLSGTVGQPDAGHMAGGQFTLEGGFWSLVAVVQNGPAPTLTITHSGNSVIVSWPSPSTGWTLQQNTSVSNPSGWSDFTGTIADNGTTRSITITSPSGTLFFRLKQ